MSEKGYVFYTSGAARQPEESTWKYHARKLATIKSIDKLTIDQKTSQLKRALSAFDLTMLGIGGIIGAGIFVLTGQAAGTKAGPAIVISYMISGFAASFAALSYSELASMIPVAGSAYTYAYAALGELMAWIIGWDLILEYLVGTAAVSVSWSEYFVRFFNDAFNVQLGKSWTSAPILFNSTTETFQRVPGTYFNVPAFVVVILLTILLIVGIKESATVNAIVVGIKILVIVVFVIAASTKIDPENYKPFVPPNEGKFSQFGATGILSAATVVFFAYIGFDSVSTTAQEAKNPQRDLPIGIVGSLIICTVLYIAVCVVLTGTISYKLLADTAAPISVAADHIGMRWLGIFVDVGALAGLITTSLVTLLGQTRIFYAMAEDGLLIPKLGTKIHSKFKTPYIVTAITGSITAVASAILPIDVLADLTSVGTLLAFVLVNLGVIILRIHAPDIPRRFKVPGGPYIVPIIGTLLDIALLASAPKASIERLFAWMAVGLVIYFFYGRTHSKVNNPTVTPNTAIAESVEIKS